MWLSNVKELSHSEPDPGSYLLRFRIFQLIVLVFQPSLFHSVSSLSSAQFLAAVYGAVFGEQAPMTHCSRICAALEKEIDKVDDSQVYDSGAVISWRATHSLRGWW